MKNDTSKAIRVMAIASFCIFLGRGLQLAFWDAPFRSIFWDENLLKNIVENWFSTAWETYVTSNKTDRNIQNFIKFCGFVLLTGAVTVCILYFKKAKKISAFIYVSCCILFFIAFLEFKEKFLQLPQFFEASIQLGTPILFLWSINKSHSVSQIILYSKILIALTFFAHGLYAMGVYNLPAHFVEMVIEILTVNETTAKTILLIAGILDIILAILIFIPNTKIIKIALIYACIWGFLTAFARLIFYWKISYNPIHSLNDIHQTIFRVCHGLVPLATLFLISPLNFLSLNNNILLTHQNKLTKINN